jgi:peroxiredoxin
MLEQGATAPMFSLPAAVDGDIETVDLASVAGTDVVVLAFYPADFSSTCTEELCSLRDMELFDLQDEVTILGVSTDTAFSHVQFAEQNGLGFPLLSDNDGSVAEQYGVLFDEGLGGHRRIAKRAVFVLDADRTVRYAWSSDDPGEMPDLAAVRTAIEELTDDEAAVERYRVAHTHHREALASFDDGRAAMEANDWLLAADAFGSAEAEFEAAVEAFEAAVRFAGDEWVAEAADRGRDVAGHYRNAARWFAQSADHRARGEGELAAEFRADATGALADAEAHEALPAPDDLAAEIDAVAGD